MYVANLNSNAQSGSENPMVIGFSTSDLNDRYLRYLEVAAREYAERNNKEFLLADAQNNAVTQQEQIKNLIEEGVQGLIVVPVDTSATAPITDMAKQAGIPLVYLNRFPFENQPIPPDVYYVGSKEYDAGTMQGDFLGENLQAGNIGILMGTPGLESTINRTKGLEDVLASKYPDIKVIAKGTANFFREPAYRIVKEWLAKYGNDLNAIAANNDEMALGAIRALQEAGRKDVTVVGIDGLDVGRRAVEEGTLAATVFQDAITQGEDSVNIVSQLINKQKPSEQINWVPYILITSVVLPEVPPLS